MLAKQVLLVAGAAQQNSEVQNLQFAKFAAALPRLVQTAQLLAAQRSTACNLRRGFELP
jgi:hypothetical protein